MLFIDPHEKDSGKICSFLHFKKSKKWKYLREEDCLMSFSNTFGFGEKTFKTGRYEGTMFWFPLRSEPSALSENICDDEQVERLFKAFLIESNRSLIFLKSICKVEMFINLFDEGRKESGSPKKKKQRTIALYTRKETFLTSMCGGKNIPFRTIAISSQEGEFSKQKNAFQESIESIAKFAVPEKTREMISNVKVTDYFMGNEEIEESTEWIILNYFKGGSVSQRTKELIEDKDLCSPPLVGLAAPIKKNIGDYKTNEGHVFCYQPLPQEKKHVTGLPVHVNAFFALSSNRRHVKWPDNDELTTAVDKEIEWNQALVREILPEAYEHILNYLVNFCKKHKNKENCVQALYYAIPELKSVDSHWRKLAESAVYRLSQIPVILAYCSNSWLTPTQAVYVNAKKWGPLSCNILRTVAKDMPELSVVPDHVTDTFQQVYPNQLKYLSPKVLSAHLLKHSRYTKELSMEEKVDLLKFLAREEKWKFLMNIELLPLENLKCTVFMEQGRFPIFLEDPKVVRILENKKDRLVLTSLDKDGIELMKRLKISGLFNIQDMSADDLFNMLSSIEEKQQISRQWILELWTNLILPCFSKDLWKLNTLKIFPVNFLDKKRNLITTSLKDKILLIPAENVKTIDELSAALALLGIQTIKTLPEWLDSPVVLQYLPTDPTGFSSLFERLSEYDISNFNRKATIRQKDLAGQYVTERLHTVKKVCANIKCIEIFQRYNSHNESEVEFSSVQSCNNLFTGKQFPVKYPFPVFRVKSKHEKELLQKLSVEIFTESKLLCAALQNIGIYEDAEKETLMVWILENESFLKDDKVLQLSQQIPFLDNGTGSLFLAKELFDPDDKVLRKVFLNEHLFPKQDHKFSNRMIQALKKLGLRQQKDIKPEEFESVVNEVHIKSKDYKPDNIERANILVNLANSNTLLLKTHAVNEMHWIPVATSDSYFKTGPFISDTCKSLSKPTAVKAKKFTHLIGSVYNVFDCSELPHLAEFFAWNTEPSTSDIITHLQNIVNNYSNNKVEYLQMIVDVYQELALRSQSNSIKLKEKWENTFCSNKACIWNGDGFSPISEIYIDSVEGDVPLQPYMHCLPKELNHIKEYFISIGCVRKLDCQVYTSVLKNIKDHSDKYNLTRNDKRMVINILGKLSDEYSNECKTCGDIQENLYFPVTTEDCDPILLKHISQCAYGSFQDFPAFSADEGDEDEEIYLIHPDVPLAIAEALGVRTVKQQMLKDADAFEEWGQEEPLTRRLHKLLKEGYVDGFSVAKELLQNADDAGATKLHILYDERENEDARTFLINPDLAEWQGPAIWVYNDALFSENDFKNITKLNGGTKEDDVTKIGKFGLGFCSVYNITDLPSFVSGNSFVMFDPHTNFIGKALPGKSPGLRIKFTEVRKQLVQRLRHQFQVFQDVFSCNILKHPKSLFKGTLFRLPLRLRGSEISPNVYTHEEVKGLLTKIVGLALNMFIFNQSVFEFKIYYLQKGCPLEASEVYNVGKQTVNLSTDQSIHVSPMLEAAKRKENQTLRDIPFHQRQHVTIVSKSNRCERLNIGEGQSSCSWLVAWATGSQDETFQITEMEKGALPLASVAVSVVPSKETGTFRCFPLDLTPSGFYKDGHYFFYLPLPIQHKFKYHINSQFSVTSDRKYLLSKNEDEKNQETGAWNECLITDTVVKALLHLLESGAQLETWEPFCLWPHKFNEPVGFEDILCRSFYDHITNTCLNSKIFPSRENFCSLSESVFLDPEIRSDEQIGDIAFKFLFRFMPYTLVDIPREIWNLMKTVNMSLTVQKTISKKQFIMKYFLPNLNMFDQSQEGERDKLMCFVLCIQDEDICEWMKQNKCVPVLPNGTLKRPCDIIDPHAKFSDLFKISDGYFPYIFYTENEICMKNLKTLGIIYKMLPDHLILDRVRTVATYASICSVCAVNQCRKIVTYIASLKKEKTFRSTTKILRKEKFLPVVMKPRDWEFVWHADALQVENKSSCHLHTGQNIQLLLEIPEHLFLQNDMNLVGSIAYVMDEHIIGLNQKGSDVYREMGVKTVLSEDKHLVTRQLITMADTYDPVLITDRYSTKRTSSILNHVYQFLNDLDKSNLIFDCLQQSSEANIVWVYGGFTKLKNVSYRHIYDCRPYLYRLEDTLLSNYRELCQKLPVQQKFSSEQIIEKLNEIEYSKKGGPLSDAEIRIYGELLSCFVESESENYMSQVINVPDIDGVLRPGQELCFNDFDDIEQSETMIYVHGSIRPQTARKLGVKKKAIQHFNDCSEDIEDFYQNEPLVDRLRGLVEKYPCDIALFKELLQNADDAKATEIHFILDKSYHPSKKVLDDKMKPLQGPALCVYNNSSFTKKDLKGIQSLGIGSKGMDPTTTGKYGVGFNVVYNLTDAPSFLTKGGEIEKGETLCMFDPLACYIPGTTRKTPGKRLKDVASIRKSHGDMFLGYHEQNYFSNGVGTMFRFPLRTASSEIKDVFNQKQLEDLLNEFQKEIPALLLFLRYLTKVVVTFYENGKYTDKTIVFTELTEKDSKEKSFFTERLKAMFYDMDQRSVLKSNQIISRYDISLKQLLPELLERRYTLVQAAGFSQSPEGYLKEVIETGKLTLKPQAAVAYEISSEGLYSKDRVYCFLPLSIETGIPVSIHGNFVLGHESRRDLWLELNGHCAKTKWNEVLITHVIADAYVILILKIKDMLTSIFSDGEHRKSGILKAVTSYQKVFPTCNTKLGHYWKLLLQSVYKKLVNNRHDFLPVLKNKTRYEDKAGYHKEFCLYTCLSWTTLYGSAFPAYHSDDSDESFAFEHTRNELLRATGMRIVTVDTDIRESMRQSGVAIEEISEKHVIDFFCSYNTTEPDKCLIEINKPVKETVLKNVHNVSVLMQFIQNDKEYLKQKFTKLPLIITQDTVVRSLENIDWIIYVTTFCDFFPNEAAFFLHTDLYTYVSKFMSLSKKSICAKLKHFELADFVSFAERSGKIPVRQTEMISWDEAKMEMKFMKTFWIFFRYCLENRKRQTMTDVIENMIKEMETLSIILCKDPISNNQFLCNTSQLVFLLDVESFFGTTKTAFKKLNIPQMNCEPLLQGKGKSRICDDSQRFKRDFCTNIPNASKPKQVLNCLCHHKERIEEADLDKEDLDMILSYFAQSEKHLDQWESPTKLKSISLFYTMDGNRQSLSNLKNIYLVPAVLPTAGLQKITQTQKIALIEEDSNLKNLYIFLGFDSLSWIQLYVRYIIPYNRLMERNEFYEHIFYIAKQQVMLNAEEFSPITDCLKQSTFISVGVPDQVQVSDLFNHKKSVFSLMCQENEILPLELRKVTSFMLHLGLKNKMNLPLFERFSKCIEAEWRRTGLTEDVRKKSEALVSELIAMPETFFKTDASFYCLARTYFVLPMQVDDKYKGLCKQFSSKSLIAYHGSVLHSKASICWTTCNLLPESALPRNNEGITALGICTQPDVDNWTEHIKGVGDAVDKILKQGKFQDEEVLENLFTDIYESVEMYKNMEGFSVEKLREIPLIYLSEKKIIIKPKNSVNSCNTDDEISPYLLRSPVQFGKHFKSFISIGAHDNLSANLPVQVLNEIHQGLREESEMLPKELADATKAMAILFRLLKSQLKEIDISERQLFLLCAYQDGNNIIKTLSDAKTIIVNDNESLKCRILQGTRNLKFLAEFEIGSQGDDVIDCVKNIPLPIRPRLVTEVAKEIVDMSRINRQSSTLRSREMENYIHSQEFIHAFLRLSRHSVKQAGSSWDKEQEVLCVDTVRNINLVRAIGICTFIRLQRESGKTEDLENTRKERTIHIEDSNQAINVYFNENANDCYGIVAEELSEFLNIKLGLKLQSTQRLLFLLKKILEKIHTNKELTEKLDEQYVEIYKGTIKVEENLYPVPGSFVPEKFHKYLDNSYGVFQEHDYRFIAYLVEDPMDTFNNDENDDSLECSQTYIYVHILSRVEALSDNPPLLQKYEIDAGEDAPKTVPAYLLFKFVRPSKKTPSSDRCLVPFSQDESVKIEDISIIDICKEIRNTLIEAWKKNENERRGIVKRIILKWHPDRNHGNEVVATKVFQYIQQCLRCLDKNPDPPEYEGKNNDFTDSGPTYKGSGHRTNTNSSGAGWWSGSWYGRYWNRYSRSRKSYPDDRTSWEQTFSFQKEPYHFYNEAKRWQKQAKYDVGDALLSLEDGESHTYNLICYKAHQAAEKSLKAAWYAKDANELVKFKKSHNLESIASELVDGLSFLTRRLSAVTGEHTRMRYPDTMSSQIPAEAYTRRQAEEATAIAQEIVKTVQQEYIK